MYFTLFQETRGALWVNICSLVSTSLEALKPSLLNILQKRNPGQGREYFSNLGGSLLCDTLLKLLGNTPTNCLWYNYISKP